MTEITRIGNIEIHPAANLFPQMDEDKISMLSKSIKENGLRVPLVFYEGKLIDGRNRLRAAFVAGLETEKLQRRNLPESTDPYEWAWDLNCSRLDYSPSQKAAIRIKIEEASGELERTRQEVRSKANESRAEKLDGIRGTDGRAKITSRASSDAPLSNTHKLASDIALRAKVSPSTVERVLKVKRTNPKAFEDLANGNLIIKHKSKATHWRVPRDITKMAYFFKERLTTSEINKLVDLLS